MYKKERSPRPGTVSPGGGAMPHYNQGSFPGGLLPPQLRPSSMNKGLVPLGTRLLHQGGW